MYIKLFLKLKRKIVHRKHEVNAKKSTIKYF